MGRFEEALPGNILDENCRESLPTYSKMKKRKVDMFLYVYIKIGL
jgi:hypothetical protein